MKHVLSLATFVMVAQCFAAFLATMKPTVLSAIEAPSKPAHCTMVGLWCVGMP